jgi:hypothetical protein
MWERWPDKILLVAVLATTAGLYALMFYRLCYVPAMLLNLNLLVLP